MKLGRLGAVAAGAAFLTFLTPVTPAEAARPLIQPGEYSVSGDSGCTLSFIYDGGGSTFVGTAAHCVRGGIGADVELSDGTVIGDVAAMGNEDWTETDWALIRVRPAYLGRVSPAVKGHPAFPRGVTTPGETAARSQVQQSGYALGLPAQPVREKRKAVLTYDDAHLFSVLGFAIYGDSGGPLVHLPTGKALGIASRLCVGSGVCEMEGPTVQGILAKAAQQGFHLTLRTV